MPRNQKTPALAPATDLTQAFLEASMGRQEAPLLADAEAREDRAEQVFAAELAGDFAEGAVGEAELFGGELAALALFEQALGFGEAFARAFEHGSAGLGA